MGFVKDHNLNRSRNKFVIIRIIKFTISGRTQPNDHLVDEVDTEKYLKNDSKWQTGFLRQYSVLAKRTFLHSKSRYLSISVTIQVLCMAAFAGLEWFQIPRTEETARDRLGIVNFSISIFCRFCKIPQIPLESMHEIWTVSESVCCPSIEA